MAKHVVIVLVFLCICSASPACTDFQIKAKDGTVVIEDVPRTDLTQAKSHFYCDACYSSFKNVDQKLVEATRKHLPLDLD
jgi:hypothetical protein